MTYDIRAIELEPVKTAVVRGRVPVTTTSRPGYLPPTTRCSASWRNRRSRRPVRRSRDMCSGRVSSTWRPGRRSPHPWGPRVVSNPATCLAGARQRPRTSAHTTRSAMRSRPSRPGSAARAPNRPGRTGRSTTATPSSSLTRVGCARTVVMPLQPVIGEPVVERRSGHGSGVGVGGRVGRRRVRRGVGRRGVGGSWCRCIRGSGCRRGSGLAVGSGVGVGLAVGVAVSSGRWSAWERSTLVGAPFDPCRPRPGSPGGRPESPDDFPGRRVCGRGH